MLRLKDTSKLNTQYTYMTEIIYPENRIVTDYGNMEDSILLEVIPLDANEVVYARPCQHVAFYCIHGGFWIFQDCHSVV